ncbi:MAG: protein translocase SEC61 complex subunit gamma [Candidatus Lokiarchaeota archaeon]|nr:protein translocase SEC61 complex subunit gamma [Candidatus Harpocratesius repetitus]
MSVAKNSPSETMNKFQRFWLNIKRIIKISTKPTKKEFFTMVKVASIGMAIIGGLYYIVQLISSLLSNN